MKLLATTLLSILCFGAVGQQHRVQLFEATPEKTVIRVLTNGFDWETIQTPKGEAKIITLEVGKRMNVAGDPDLPMITVMLPAPEGFKLRANPSYNWSTDFDLK